MKKNIYLLISILMISCSSITSDQLKQQNTKSKNNDLTLDISETSEETIGLSIDEQDKDIKQHKIKLSLYEDEKTEVLNEEKKRKIEIFNKSTNSENDYKKKFILPPEEVKAYIKEVSKKVAEWKIRKALFKDYEFNPVVVKRVKEGRREKSNDRIVTPESGQLKGIKTVNWNFYSRIFIEKERIENGVQFYMENEKLFNEIERKYEVDAMVVVAILGIETKYGRIMGKYNVLNTLITNSFHPDSHRHGFFRRQLTAFLELVEENPFMYDISGSYAGAMGMGQFIPTSYQHYAVDNDGDGLVNLFGSLSDGAASIANYLIKNKWVSGQKIAYMLEDLSHSDFGVNDEKKGTKLMLDNLNLRLSDIINTKNIILFVTEDKRQLWKVLPNFKVIKTYNSLNSYAISVNVLAEEIGKRINQL